MNSILFLIILIPVVEIYLFIKIGAQIGALTTILLIFITAILGVYYLEGGSQIQFFDPRPQASVLHPNLKYTNFDNSGMIGFDAEKGTGLIFPSWLQHWVVKTNKTRISISWNILLRGDYGQPGTLQNSHI